MMSVLTSRMMAAGPSAALLACRGLPRAQWLGLTPSLVAKPLAYPARVQSTHPPPLDGLERVRREMEELNHGDKLMLLQQLQQAIHEEDASPSSPPGDPAGPSGPSGRTIALYSVHQALPFVGFGFLDNLIMILAGEYIDKTLGLTLGISTMAAAALGNAVSDAFGIGSAWYVEHWIGRLGITHPHLSLEERALSRVRLGANAGRALGVIVGCLVGMFPLLFM